MPHRLLVASKLLETWIFGALMMSCIVCKEENKLSPQLILKLNTSSAVWQKVCLIWTWNIEGKTENGWERKRDQFAKFYRNWFFLSAEFQSHFAVFPLFLVHIPGRAESSSSFGHSFGPITKISEDENLTKSLVVITDHSVFTFMKAAEIFDLIHLKSKPITYLFCDNFHMLAQKWAQITRWQRSSCLSTVLSVYLLLGCGEAKLT